MDLRRILIPLDGSELAEQALPLAEQLAARAGAELVLTRPPLARVFSSMDAMDVDGAESGAQAEADTYLGTVCERLGPNVHCRLATPYSPHEEHGLLVGQVTRPSLPFRQLADVAREAAEAIAQQAESDGVDLIVMATRGRSGLGRWIYGDEALEILHRVSAPLLLVRSGAPETLPEGEALKVLVPLEGSTLAEAALQPASDLAALMGGSLLLVRVVPALRRSVVGWLTGPFTVEPAEHAALEAAAQSYLDATVAAMRERGVRAEGVVLEGNAAEVIADAAAERHCALVAVATHGRLGLARVASEHVAEAIMANAPALVLAIRAEDSDEAPLAMADNAEAAADVHTGPIGDATRAALAARERTVPVALNATERDLIQTALQSLLQTVRRDEHLGGPIQQLLAKLAEADRRN